MLQHIEVSNFILIDHLSLPVSSGMTVMTGETGAGKSILLGALSAALGGRLSAKSVLKDSSKKAVIELMIRVKEELRDEFEHLDVDYAEDTVFRRELLPSGKSRCFINDTPVKAADLARIAGTFIDINSQSDAGLLYRIGQQMELIDAFATVKKEKGHYADAYRAFTRLTQELEALKELGAADDLDYLTFVVNEMKSFSIEPGEYERLEDELIRAKAHREDQSKFETLLSKIGQAGGALDALFEVEAALLKIAENSDAYETFTSELQASISSLQNLERTAKNTLSNEISAEELDELRKRKSQIDGLVRKHRVGSAEELMEKRAALIEKLETLQNKETEIARLEQELTSAVVSLREAAEALHSKRKKASAKIQKAFATYLERVDLPKARLELDWEEIEPSAYGCYRPVFLFAANPGSGLEPLHKVASGGEQSRVKLALKAVLGQHASLSAQIFDEIDTGISGSTAEKVGGLMKELAQTQQIITITHLPQVAAAGSAHWKVSKSQTKTDTVSNVRTLEQDERISEIARMLSGSKITDAAKNQAEVLLNAL
jgi:DNA repair protein RecN (Recombination protein N)